MNPLLLLGGAAALILFLMTRKTHAMVRRDSPYDRAGGSSFTPPPPPPPEGDGGFTAGANTGFEDPSALPKSRAGKQTFGGSPVQRGASLSRQKALSETLRAQKASQGPGFGALGPRDMLDPAILNTHPEDTDAWLALYDNDPIVRNAMKSWNKIAGDMFNRWGALGIVHPGWTKDLGWAGGLTSAEQQSLLDAARLHLAAGNSDETTMTEKQMLNTLRSAFARSTQHPVNDLKTSPELVAMLVEQYLTDVQEGPSLPPGQSIQWPNKQITDEAKRLSAEAWDALATETMGTAPAYSELAPAFQRLLNKVMLQAIYSGQPPTVIVPYIKQYMKSQAAIALQNIYDEFPGITPDEAKEKLQAELGWGIDDVEDTWDTASDVVAQGSDALDEASNWL